MLTEPTNLFDGLEYNPSTGRFYNTKTSRFIGNKVNPKGYLRISYGGKERACHRVAWYMTYGYWPSVVDHINGNKADNRISNLRDVTPAINNQNSIKPYKNNSSGFKGVHQYRDGRWVCQLSLKGKKYFGGYHETPEQAFAEYLKKKKELHAGYVEST